LYHLGHSSPCIEGMARAATVARITARRMGAFHQVLGARGLARYALRDCAPGNS
jgi:hypothetical protein